MPTSDRPVTVIEGDCREAVAGIHDDAFDAIVSDPPYGLSFMGKGWDHDVPGPEYWSAFLRVVKPGSYLVAMGGTRTYHRLTCAVEDAGFEIRDCLSWLYGTGFPKGRGCLKPAWEPIVLARKPGRTSTPLQIDACRVETADAIHTTRNTAIGRRNDDAWQPRPGTIEGHPAGRYPANVVHDGSDEVMVAFAAFGERPTRDGSANNRRGDRLGYMGGARGGEPQTVYGDTGTAARFFYCAKASKAERGPGNTHPTVKPLALTRWLVRLVCPSGGLILDPFGGSGTTGKAAVAEGATAVLIERDAGHAAIARRRVAEAMGGELLNGT